MSHFESLLQPFDQRADRDMPQDPELQTTWTAFLDRLRSEIPDDVFCVWLQPLRAVALSEGVLYIHAPRQTRDWVQRRFGAALSLMLASIDPSLKRVELVNEVKGAQRGGTLAGRASGLKPGLQFEDFVIGAGNRFAHAAALAAAELPGQAYNPLFLHGSPGVGKTHLLNAIGHYTALNDKALTVLYVTGETFTSDFTSAIRSGEMELFKKRYRRADLLLLDDVQFVESKPRTGEELLHTFDALITAGAQVVIAADRRPPAMPALDSRFRDRLESGLVVDIEPPDYGTRLSIIRKRAGKLLDGSSSGEALELLAQRVSSSVHALEGALIRVRAYASLTQQPITPALVEHVLSNLYAPSPTSGQAGDKPSVDHIQKATSGALALDQTDLSSPKRGRQVVYARQVAMYLCRELTDLSLPAIGQRFGGRDHTTVLHAHRQVRARILTDDSTRTLVDKIISELGHSSPRP
jgi:chromosomal replication initiator protein